MYFGVIYAIHDTLTQFREHSENSYFSRVIVLVQIFLADAVAYLYD